jgi:hypothetical protein
MQGLKFFVTVTGEGVSQPTPFTGQLGTRGGKNLSTESVGKPVARDGMGKMDVRKLLSETVANFPVSK